MGIIAVLAAAAVAWVYGALHYMILSKPWMEAAGIPRGPDGKPQTGGSPLPFVLSAIAMVVVAGFMRHIFATSGVATPGAGLLSGLGIGAFFILPWIAINNAYGRKPAGLTVIDGGYAVVGCGLIGLVLTLF
ncbi:DUF1761 domain-containing protein [Histidinibacterium lentulum]|uniref:DUF1761 domain-containing protein n=1 Tax=Histidinibacterium lentulum TaxID=2480588 RepID=A0A3N2R737_9RHOB|nr:DUF1761 domain-containing protein [Histidinibacterium lentulum]ROU03193.1 DUF1761 domain-containing protein [Histidinibacterium lentulum]